MRVNIESLKNKIKENNLTQEKTAEMIGVDRSTFSRKMSNHALKFSIGEMHKMCDVLHISNHEAQQIFLCK